MITKYELLQNKYYRKIYGSKFCTILRTIKHKFIANKTKKLLDKNYGKNIIFYNSNKPTDDGRLFAILKSAVKNRVHILVRNEQEKDMINNFLKTVDYFKDKDFTPSIYVSNNELHANFNLQILLFCDKNGYSVARDCNFKIMGGFVSNPNIPLNSYKVQRI